jgi:hypothetical protein
VSRKVDFRSRYINPPRINATLFVGGISKCAASEVCRIGYWEFDRDTKKGFWWAPNGFRELWQERSVNCRSVEKWTTRQVFDSDVFLDEREVQREQRNPSPPWNIKQCVLQTNSQAADTVCSLFIGWKRRVDARGTHMHRLGMFVSFFLSIEAGDLPILRSYRSRLRCAYPICVHPFRVSESIRLYICQCTNLGLNAVKTAFDSIVGIPVTGLHTNMRRTCCQPHPSSCAGKKCTFERVHQE